MNSDHRDCVFYKEPFRPFRPRRELQGGADAGRRRRRRTGGSGRALQQRAGFFILAATDEDSEAEADADANAWVDLLQKIISVTEFVNLAFLTKL